MITERHANLHNEIIRKFDAPLALELPDDCYLYATAYRPVIRKKKTEIEMWKIRNGRFSESEWEQFVLAMQDLSTLPFYIDDTGGISIAQIAARARRMQREKKIGCVMIDHIQLVAGSGRPENRGRNAREDRFEIRTAR